MLGTNNNSTQIELALKDHATQELKTVASF